MLDDLITDSGSCSDEIRDRVYLKRSCNRLECMVYKDLVPKYLISDDSSSRLICSTCRKKFRLRLILKARSCKVYIQSGTEMTLDAVVRSNLDFPEDWSSFIIEKL